jgi:serine protease
MSSMDKLVQDTPRPGRARPLRRTGRRFAARAALAAIAATALIAAFAAPGSAATAASPPRAQGGNYWTNVWLHGHWIKVHTHGRFGKVPQHHGRAQALRQAGNLAYNGGPVVHSPAVYLDFWGSQWDSDSNGVEQYMQSFMSGLGQSDDNWSPINSQYTDSSGQGPSFGGSVLAGTWVDDGGPAPQSASQSDLAAEAVTAAQHFGVAGPDIQIVVLSPSGTNPDGFPNSGFCAWHDFTSSSAGDIPYTNMPYVLDAGSGCGASSVQGPLDGFSIVEGHEYAETLTDPEPSSGWIDDQGAEIGDKCAWQNLFAINLSTGSFAMQPLWSNNDNGCTQQAP